MLLCRWLLPRLCSRGVYSLAYPQACPLACLASPEACLWARPVMEAHEVLLEQLRELCELSAGLPQGKRKSQHNLKRSSS